MVIRREDLYWLYRAIASRTTGLSRRLRLSGQVDRLETIARMLEERAGQLDRSVAGLADEIVVIAGGQIAHRGTTEEIFPLILADTLGSCPVLERKEGAQ